MNRTARRETYCRQAVHKLITSLHSKCSLLSGMLMHLQNSYAPHGKQRTARREAQSRGTKLKRTLCICEAISCIMGKNNDDRGLMVNDEVGMKLRRTK
jgi:hypothetical protein